MSNNYSEMKKVIEEKLKEDGYSGDEIESIVKIVHDIYNLHVPIVNNLNFCKVYKESSNGEDGPLKLLFTSNLDDIIYNLMLTINDDGYEFKDNHNRFTIKKDKSDLVICTTYNNDVLVLRGNSQKFKFSLYTETESVDKIADFCDYYLECVFNDNKYILDFKSRYEYVSKSDVNELEKCIILLIEWYKSVKEKFIDLFDPMIRRR